MTQVKDAIAVGTLQAAQQLPSAKSLALQLAVNANTIIHAYRELEREGLIETVVGRGTFVKRDAETRGSARQGRIESVSVALESAMAQALSYGLSPSELQELALRAVAAACRGLENS